MSNYLKNFEELKNPRDITNLVGRLVHLYFPKKKEFYTGQFSIIQVERGELARVKIKLLNFCGPNDKPSTLKAYKESVKTSTYIIFPNVFFKDFLYKEMY